MPKSTWQIFCEFVDIVDICPAVSPCTSGGCTILACVGRINVGGVDWQVGGIVMGVVTTLGSPDKKVMWAVDPNNMAVFPHQGFEALATDMHTQSGFGLMVEVG
jgi:hypothetical protein